MAACARHGYTKILVPADMKDCVGEVSGDDEMTPLIEDHKRPSFTGPIVLSCVVFWCTGFLFGLVAFILAILGQSFLDRGQKMSARRMSQASYAVSIIGIFVSVVVLICVLLFAGLLCHHQPSCSNGFIQDVYGCKICCDNDSHNSITHDRAVSICLVGNKSIVSTAASGLGLSNRNGNYSKPKKLVNIDYVGVGYDVIKGNPHSNNYDPGFKLAVVKLTYFDLSLSTDGRWKVPDNVQALQALSCNYKTESEVVHGAESYSNSLSVDASVEGGGWGVKFSASAGYKNVKSGTSGFHRTYLESVAKCTHYRVQFNSRSKMRLTDAFLEDLQKLPEVQNLTDYFEFISRYGTHYADSVMMGAKMTIRSEFEQKSWTEMQQRNINVKAGAQFSFLGFTGGFSAATADEKIAKKKKVPTATLR